MGIRRVFALFLCLCLGAVFIGCGKQPDPEITVGICIADSALPIHTAAKDALTTQFPNTALSEAKGDADLQLRQAEVYLQEGYSLLVAEPVDKQTGLALAELSNRYETPVIFTDFSEDDSLCRQANLGGSIYLDPFSAVLESKKLLELLPNGGDTNQDGVISYLVVSGPAEDTFQDAIVQRWLESMEADQEQLLRTVICDGTSQSVREACDQALADYGRDIEVIFATHEDIAMGVLEAIRDRGWYPGTDNYVLAVSKQDCTRLLQEGVSGVVFPDAETYAKRITSIAEKLFQPTPSADSLPGPWLGVR